ncbi:MAG: type II toxin-antitoxin system VapB family antitoxin [Bryobacteraceae bacterium]|jgi:antitoxin VapB
MALSIKHSQADQLARELAAATGVSITEAVIRALSEQLKRETGRRTAARLKQDLRAISDRCASLPDRDPRTPEEIIGFDERGIPS